MDNSQKLQNLPDLLPNSKQEFIINQRQPTLNEFEAQKLVDEDDEASEVDDSKDDGKKFIKVLDSIRRRNRRRSKNDNDGRSYRCQNCGKAYLSYPALYTHIKTKHDLQSTGSTKGRGRPKKDIGVAVTIFIYFR